MSQVKYKQRTLGSFLKSSKYKDLYFHLKSDNGKLKATFTTELTDDDFKNVKIVTQIKWPFLEKLLTISYQQDLEDLFNVDTTFVQKQPSKSKDIAWSAILKSHLQKAIRRKDFNLALATADELITFDPVIFLRRLPIIVLEDTYLFKDYPVLVWLMCYYSENKRRRVSDYWTQWLLRVTGLLTETSQKDPYPELDPETLQTLKVKNSLRSPERLFIPKDIPKYLNGYQRDLIYSMQLRKSYGGMKCDGRMLDRYCHKWVKIFNSLQFSATNHNGHSKESDITSDSQGATDENEYLIRPWPEIPVKVDALSKNNFILAAIDFHCCPEMIPKLVHIHQNFTEEEIRQAIWYFSSGINYREMDDQPSKLVPVWDKIKDNVLLFQKVILGQHI